MKEIKGDLFSYIGRVPLCITTNGFVSGRGLAVMGRGCAKQAKIHFPGIDRTLGRMISENGNIVQILVANPTVISFPVKPISWKCDGRKQFIVPHMQYRYNKGDEVPGWACVASERIIDISAHQLVELTDEMGWDNVLLPRPGCGAGSLNWKRIGPMLNSILDDRFYSITY